MIEKKICIISKFFYENDTRLQQQANTLSSAGFKVDVICYHSNHSNKVRDTRIAVHGVARPIPKGTILKYAWSTMVFIWASFWKLQKLALRQKFDLIVVHTLPELLVFISLFQKMRGTKLLLDVRDTSVELFETKWGKDQRKLLNKFVRILSSISCRFADHIITASTGFKEKLVSRDVPEKKVSIIYNTADTSIFKFDYQRKYKEIRSGAKLIYHGTVAQRFGIDIAIRSLALLQEKIPDSELKIFGFYDEDYKAKLNELISELNLGKLVHLNGRESLENIYESIKNSDIGIVPYRSDDFMQLALSTKMFEYVASGIPVVASRLRPAEFVFNDRCISYAAPNEPKEFAENIENLCLNPELKKSLVENAFTAHNKVSSEVMSKLYLDTVRNLIDKK